MKNKFATTICFLNLMILAVSMTIISPLLVAISKAFSIGISESGIIFTADFFGNIIFSLTGGFLAARYGKKKILMTALFGFTLAMAAIWLSTNFFMLCVIMFFYGGACGIMESMSMALVSELNTERPEFYVNLSQVFFGIGALIGPVLASFFINSAFGWKACYFLLGLISLSISILFATCHIPHLQTVKALNIRDMKPIFMNGSFLLVCLCIAFYTGSEIGAWGWLCTLLKQKFSFSTASSSLAVSVFWIAMTVGRLLCGKLTSWFNLRKIIIMLAFTSAAVTFLSCIVGSQLFIWVIVALMGLTYSSQYPLITSYGSSISSAPSSIVFAVIGACGSIGSSSIPYLMGLLGDHTTMSEAMIFPAVLLLMIGILFTALGRKKRVSEKI